MFSSLDEVTYPAPWGQGQASVGPFPRQDSPASLSVEQGHSALRSFFSRVHLGVMSEKETRDNKFRLHLKRVGP